ncbi:MAG: hypothetical protein IEMM0002_0269 [bacterium]|nr:MAG: hypothetical protein IEMM0002_0269 [bacterium]
MVQKINSAPKAVAPIRGAGRAYRCSRLRRDTGGFTLIEIIGVLAIIVILAGMIAPTVVQQIQGSKASAEEGNLDNIAESLLAFILQQKIIPASFLGSRATGCDTTTAVEWDWAACVASMDNIPQSFIAQSDNGQGCNRLYWFDPATNLPDLSTGGSYDQNSDVVPICDTSLAACDSPAEFTAATPRNTRAMIISDMTGGCSASLTVSDATTFNNTWNQTTGGYTESPTLTIKRINFSQIFEEISLLNRTNTQYGKQTFYNVPTGPGDASQPVISFPNTVTVQNVYVSGDFRDQAGDPRYQLDIGYGAGCEGAGTCFIGLTNLGVLPANAPNLNVPNVAVIQAEVKSTSANAGETPIDGYVGITVEYEADTGYNLAGRAGPPGSPPAQLAAAGGGSTAATTIWVINGTELRLYSNDVAAARQLLAVVVKEADSFMFSPGPPAIWGR